MKTFTRFALGTSLFAMATAMSFSASAADMVVIQSSGGALQQGQVIDGSQAIDLAAGESLTLIGADGAPVTLSGPYSGAPGAGGGGDKGIATAIAGLFAGPKISTASLGAVRAATAEAEEQKVSKPWVVSVEGSGPRCIESGVASLWRADASKTSKITLSDGVHSGSASWPAGHNEMAMPAGYFKDGRTYTTTIEEKVVELTIRMLPGTLSSDVEKVAWMANQGCTDQAMALLQNVK